MHYLRPKGKGLKLHLGCGDYWQEGALNIDISVYGGTDMIWDLREGIPLQDAVVEIIEMYEVVEHFSPREIANLLDECYRVLIPDGKIRVSVPDMDKVIEHYLQDKHKTIEWIYWYEEHANHKDGYTKEKIQKLFEDHRFLAVTVEQGFLPERPEEPKLILEAVK